MTKYKIGDQVVVCPNKELKKGIIVEAKKTQGIDSYSLHFPCGFGGKMAWYSNSEVMLIYSPAYQK